MKKIIDLRSDTVTKPTDAMREAMARAEVGDDVYGEDPTINRLEALAAEMLGKEAAVFAPSGTQSNLIGVLAHCQRGDEYIVGQHAHTYKYEGGGAAVLGSIQPQPIDLEPDGSLDLDKVARAVKPDDFHFARTRLLCLENTHRGMALPMDYLARAEAFARDCGLSIHLDGARVFNAAVKLGVPVSDIARHFDSVSICLSKGLGAPVGSLLCASQSLVKEARRWRKVLGGGMRQAGVLAAAGIIALEQHVERLAEDHANAARLAGGLSDIDGISVDRAAVQTNMVFASMSGEIVDRLVEFLAGRGILILGGKMLGGPTIRIVTHLDVTSEDIDILAAAIREFFDKEA
ncbi:MAG: low-specificity L-threonine aldolase [Phycisphaerae bacterium]|jgi:threonine aldolase|nr:low-specificity L-threonine aldolase [Phycisphaerae bacterium]